MKIKNKGPPAVPIGRRGGQPPASAEIWEMGKIRKIRKIKKINQKLKILAICGAEAPLEAAGDIHMVISGPFVWPAARRRGIGKLIKLIKLKIKVTVQCSESSSGHSGKKEN